MSKYRVTYWIGTTQYIGTANTASEVAKLVAKNRNAFDPIITDIESGKGLHLTCETVRGGKVVPVLWNENCEAV